MKKITNTLRPVAFGATFVLPIAIVAAPIVALGALVSIILDFAEEGWDIGSRFRPWAVKRIQRETGRIRRDGRML